MKKAAIFFIFIAFISCKKDLGTSFKGDFVYYANAAVFQVGNDIHGVVLNDQANALAEQAKQYQQEPTDMVTIEVLGELIPKKENVLFHLSIRSPCLTNRQDWDLYALSVNH